MGSTFTGIKESENENESQTERTIMESGFGLEQLYADQKDVLDTPFSTLEIPNSSARRFVTPGSH